jgi:hypothetical protein
VQPGELADGRPSPPPPRRDGAAPGTGADGRRLRPYRYLLRIALDPAVNDATINAVSDWPPPGGTGRRSLATLDEFLARRGAISATADALHVPRTRSTGGCVDRHALGIDLRRDDWLALGSP